MFACQTYEEYATVGTKARPLTLKQLFVRQLMVGTCAHMAIFKIMSVHAQTIAGVSSKAAASIVDKYATFSALCSAYERCANRAQADMMLNNVFGTKVINKPVSARLAKMFAPANVL